METNEQRRVHLSTEIASNKRRRDRRVIVMTQVYTFSRSDSEILEALLKVFNTGRGTAKEQWGMQAELLVEPVGWDGLWKLSKAFCKKFEVRFPCIAIISVTSVDFENLSADVEVLSVQHEMVSLPESVQDVPLVELWPTQQQREASIEAGVTAEFIDILRFFYTNIWMPWDDQDDKVLLPNTIEERMQLWSDLHNGTIPNCMARSITLLRNSAIDAHDRLKELDSSLCEGQLTDDDDSLLPPSYIALCGELSARLDGLMAKWTLYENTLIREQSLAKYKSEAQANRINVVALWQGGDVFEFDAITQFVRARVSAEQSLCMLRSAEEALSLAPGELVLCGKHCDLPEVALKDIAICSYNGTTITSSEIRSCLLQTGAACSVRDVTLQCARASTALLARAGRVQLDNCVLRDTAAVQQSIAQGIVAMSGAKIQLTDCTLDCFYSGIVAHKGAQVELRNCFIKNCGVGIQMYSGSHVTLQNTTIADCTEQSIRYETDRHERRQGNAIEGLNIMSCCTIGSGEAHKEILVVKQDNSL